MRVAQAIRRGGEVRRERFGGAARLFFAAADPVRLRIFRILAERGEACVSDLALELGMSAAVVSHHLRLLRECRCLKTVRSGKMVCYQFIPNEFTRFVISRISHAP